MRKIHVSRIKNNKFINLFSKKDFVLKIQKENISDLNKLVDYELSKHINPVYFDTAEMVSKQNINQDLIFQRLNNTELLRIKPKDFQKENEFIFLIIILEKLYIIPKPSNIDIIEFSIFKEFEKYPEYFI